MTDLTELLAKYDAWSERRTDLFNREAEGNYPAPSEFHASDDDAVDLLEAFVTALRPTPFKTSTRHPLLFPDEDAVELHSSQPVWIEPSSERPHPRAPRRIDFWVASGLLFDEFEIEDYTLEQFVDFWNETLRP